MTVECEDCKTTRGVVRARFRMESGAAFDLGHYCEPCLTIRMQRFEDSLTTQNKLVESGCSLDEAHAVMDRKGKPS